MWSRGRWQSNALQGTASKPRLLGYEIVEDIDEDNTIFEIYRLSEAEVRSPLL